MKNEKWFYFLFNGLRVIIISVLFIPNKNKMNIILFK